MSAPSAEPHRIGLRDLWEQPAFVRYQLVRLTSVISIQILSVVVGYQTWERTEDPTALGWIGGAQFVPMLLLIFVSGEVADRFDRRTILQVCQLGIGAVAGALLLLSRFPETTVFGSPMGGVYLALFLFGALRAFAGPAAQALVPSLVPVALYPRAVAISATTFQVAIVLGPALGGILYGAFGAEVAYGLAAVLQGIAAFVLFAVHAPYEPRRAAEGPMRERLLGGLRYVRERPIILGAISLDLFAVLLGGAVALMPIYARDILHVGAAGLGVLRSAPAIGAAIVAVGLGVRPLGRHAGTILFVCVALFGAATIVFGLSTNLVMSVLALVVLGASDMVSVVVRQVVVQGTTPPEMRGRVAAVNLLFISASNELGELESGFLGGAIGPVQAVVLGGALSIVVTIVWAFLFPSLRRFGSEDASPSPR